MELDNGSTMIGATALGGIDEYVWNHTFTVTSQKLVVGKGVLIMIFDPKAALKWSGEDTRQGSVAGRPVMPGDNVVAYDATVRFH